MKYVELTSARRSGGVFAATAARPRLKLMPCPMPDTTAAVINPASDEKYSAAARITVPAIRIAHPRAIARSGLIPLAPSWASAEEAKIRADDEARHQMVLDADHLREERRRHGGEQPADREPGERGDRRDDEHRAHLAGHRNALKPNASRAGRGLRDDEDRDGGEHHEPDVHDEGQMQRRGGVLDKHPGQKRSGAEPADVGDGRDRGRAAAPFRRRRLDDRRRRRARHKARRKTGEHPADQQQRHRIGDKEHHRARQRRHQPRRKDRPPAHRVGPPAEHQQREQHAAGIGGIDHRRGQHREVHAFGVERVDRRRQRRAEHHRRECVRQKRKCEPSGAYGRLWLSRIEHIE